MKYKLSLLVVIVALFASVMQMSAQDSAACSPQDVAGRLSSVYTAYSDATGDDGDTETALDSIDVMREQIDAIYAECDEARFQEYVPEGEALLEDLRAGGYIIYVRHTSTDGSQEDTSLDSCETQRNLTEQGRAEATAMGAVWATLNVPVGRLISTEYCRTRDTAQLAFGEPEIIPRAELETSLDEILAELPADGTNTVIVGHVDLLEEVTGINIPEDVRLNEGDALVFRPLGGAMGSTGYQMVTRISYRNWADLARIATPQMR
jgi:phosphohistidine phosphatase SixA